MLTEELGALVGGLAFGRSMRWSGEATFSRPVRWLLALHGAHVLPFAFGPLRAGAALSCQRPDAHGTRLLQAVVLVPVVKTKCRGASMVPGPARCHQPCACKCMD